MREKQFNRFHLTLSQNVLPKFTQETIDILTDEKKKEQLKVHSPKEKKEIWAAIYSQKRNQKINKYMRCLATVSSTMKTKIRMNTISCVWNW